MRVTAAPEHGRANEAVIALIAETLAVPKSHVTVTRGAASREKMLEIEGLHASAVRNALGASAFKDPGYDR